MKRTLSLLVLAAGLSTLPLTGCTLVVKSEGGGGTHSQEAEGEPVRGEPPASGEATPKDMGGGEAEPAPQASRPPRRKRPRPRPRQRARTARHKHFVGAYRCCYRHLPNRGSSKRFFLGLGHKIDMGGGYIDGDMKFHGQGMFKKGMGKGQTVVDGNLRINGDGWNLENLTITGNVKIRGKNNRIKAEIFGRVDVKGTGNKIIHQ